MVIEKADFADIIRKNFSKLTGSELKMLCAIAGKTNSLGYCSTSNKEFVELMSIDEENKVSERTISALVASLIAKKVITLTLNRHKNQRWLFIKGYSRYKKIVDEEFMSEEQLKFHKAFPRKQIDCAVPGHVDIDKLIEMIKRQPFVAQTDNMGLYSCCIKNYKLIMDEHWPAPENLNLQSKMSTSRDYSEKETNSLYQSAEEIKI